jgi:type VI secretion system protein ImpG
VSVLAADGTATTDYEPFFSVKHADAGRGLGRYWHAVRRQAVGSEDQPDFGSEVYLSLVDLDFSPSAPDEGTLAVETVCLNRDLPYRLPFGGDQPHLSFSEADALVARIRCLTAPTRTLRPALKKGAMWRLISHLSLNHLSLEGGPDGATALREILKLYDFADSEETRTMITGVLNVQSRRVVARTGGDGGDAVCRGVEAEIRFDAKCFAGSGLYLFASVLERFLALYVTINSFTRLVTTVEGRKEDLWRWPPRMGEKILL